MGSIGCLKSKNRNRKGAPKLDRIFCQAIVLLFPKSHGVRHQLLNKLFDSIMYSSEKTSARV